MQVYTTNKTSGSIYIIKKHPQHVTPLNGVRCFFRSNEIQFLSPKKGFGWSSGGFLPGSPPRHLDHRASVLHIVQLAARVHPSDRWFEGGLVDGKGWDGRWCFSRICPLFGWEYLRYVCWKKMHIMMWKEIGHIGDHSYCDGTSRSGWNFADYHHLYLQKKRSGFCSGGKKGGSLLSRTSAKGCAFCWGRWWSKYHPQPSSHSWPRVTEPLPSSSISWYAACRYGAKNAGNIPKQSGNCV